MLRRVSLSNNHNNATKGNIVKSVSGSISLDDIINEIVFDKEDVESLVSIKKKEEIYKQVKTLSEKYLTKSERLVYCLCVDGNKTIAEIERIMSFGCWYTSEKHVLRVFKILKIYYDYHNLDLEELQKILKKNFTPYERKIIKCLHNRKTYNEITEEMNMYYRKIYYDCKEIFSKLENLGEVGKGYAYFLKEIRKFKKSREE